MTDSPDQAAAPAAAEVAAVRVLARLVRVLDSVDSGLTIPQYRVLAAISQGGVRSAHLAERLAVRRPTLTAIADGLVAAGYAVRESEPGDRRVVRLLVTDAGRAALRAADTAYVGKIGPLLAEIPHPDRFIEDLHSVGDALDARLRAHLPEPPAAEPEQPAAALVRPAAEPEPPAVEDAVPASLSSAPTEDAR